MEDGGHDNGVHDNVVHDIGKTIGELRRKKGWTQSRLAEMLNVSDKAVSKWECGDGNPDIATFPLLADAFGVSIDYLMTGKERVELVFTSEQEQCAIRDDMSVLGGVGIFDLDNRGKCLLDYCLAHESVKVFSEIMGKSAYLIMDTLTSSGFFRVSARERADGPLRDFSPSDFVRMCLITGTVQALRHKEFPDGIKSMLPAEERGRTGRYRLAQRCLLTPSVFECIACDDRVSEETLSYLFSEDAPSPRGERGAFWALGLPYVLDRCYEKGAAERFSRALEAAERENSVSFRALEGYDAARERGDVRRPADFGYFTVRCDGCLAFTRALRRTVDLALERGDRETAERLISMNEAVRGVDGGPGFDAYVPDGRTMYEARVRSDPDLSESEKAVLLCVHDGILDVGEIVNVDDEEAVRKALRSYPVDVKEMAAGFMEKGDWPALFRYAVDAGDETLADCAILAYPDGCKTELLERERGGIPRDRWGYAYPCGGSDEFDAAVSGIRAGKERTLDNYVLRRQYERHKGDTPKRHFADLLARKDYKMAVIELCALLEDALRNKYGYEGDLCDMIDAYCDERGEGEGARGMLHRLRMYRNAIVHADRGGNLSAAEIDVEEIRRCVDYVYGLA